MTEYTVVTAGFMIVQLRLNAFMLTIAWVLVSLEGRRWRGGTGGNVL